MSLATRKVPWLTTSPQYPLARLRALQSSIRAPDLKNLGYIRQKANNKLWVHDRIAKLLDESSFEEIGSISGKHAAHRNHTDFIPAYVLVGLNIAAFTIR